MKKKLLSSLLFLVIFPGYANSACIDLQDFRVFRDNFVDLRTGLNWNRCPVNYELDIVDNQAVCLAKLPAESMGFSDYGQALLAGTNNALVNGYRPVSEKEMLSVMDFCTNSASYLNPSLFPKLVPYPARYLLTSNGSRLFYLKNSTPFYADSLVNKVLDLTNVVYTVAQ